MTNTDAKPVTPMASWTRAGGGEGWGYLEGLESLPGVGLVALMHQLSHLLGAACLALLIHRVDPAQHHPHRH